MWKQVSPAATANYHCMFTLTHSFIQPFIHSATSWVACGISTLISTQDPWLEVGEQVRVDTRAPPRVMAFSTQDPWLEVGEQVRVDTRAPPRVMASMCRRTHHIPLCSILSRGAFLAWGSSSPRWACIPLFTNFSPGALGRNRGQRSE